MPVKRSIRMKQRPRAKASKRAARTAWWTGKPAIGAAIGLAIAVMSMASAVVIVRCTPLRFANVS